MPTLIRAEDFVSYRIAPAASRVLWDGWDGSAPAPADSASQEEQRNYRTRQFLLRLQQTLAQGDSEFDANHFRDALTLYQSAGQLILSLLDPAVAIEPVPRVFPNNANIVAGLLDATAGILFNLAPTAGMQRFAMLKAPVTIAPGDLGISSFTGIAPQQTAPGAASQLAELAGTAIEEGQWDQAESLFTQALSKLANEAPNDARSQATLLLNLGAAQVQRNNAAGALANLQRAQALFHSLGDSFGEAQAIHNSALAQVVNGDLQGALDTFGHAQTLSTQAFVQDPTRLHLVSTTGGGISFSPVRFIAPGALHLGVSPAVPPPVVAVPPSGAPVVGGSDALTAQLATQDLHLRILPLQQGASASAVMLAPINAQIAQPVGRTLTLSAAGAVRTIAWDRFTEPAVQALIDNLYKPRISFKNPDAVGLPSQGVIDLAAQLPHIYHFVLPVKMGGCFQQLQEYQNAENEYRRAAAFQFVNLQLEAPDLWRRVAENTLAWGDSFYRDGDSNGALPIYGNMVASDASAPNSFLYTDPVFQPTGLKVRAWLTAIAANQSPPDLNPAIAVILQRLRKRWQYLNAGLDFFGQTDAGVPPFTFDFLQNTARYFANAAIQSEQRFIEFMDRYQAAQMTRLDLQHASDLAAKELEAAAARQTEAQALVDSAQHSVDLAQTRFQDATNTLSLFNSTAWEAEELAGFIARGSAFTGSDQPNLNYQIGDTSYSGPKHQVLQQLTKRQTEIGIDLQRDHLQSAVDELDKARQVAADQKAAADAHLKGAQIDSQIATLDEQHANEMLQSFDSQFFTPEQWWAMAMFMRGLSSTALTRAIDIAKLMQRAYNFENLDSRGIIRNFYDFGMKGLLGGEMLLADIDGFTHYQVTTIRHKPIPVKWPISLAESYPGQFELEFKRTGRMEFETDFSELTLLFPGTYRHQLAYVQVEFEGFIPPEGLHGRLKNSGLTHYRDRDGKTHLRVQPAETLALSPYSLARDSLLLTPNPEMRPLFAGASVASGWTLEVSPSANDVDLRNIFDARLVLFFECLFDEGLFLKDSQPPPATTFKRTRGLHLRFGFPDAYFTLRQQGTATLTLDARDFPFNQRQPLINALALAAVPVNGASLSGVGVSFTPPGAANPIQLTFDNSNTIPRKNIPITGTPSAFGDYRFQFGADGVKDKLADLILIMDYTFQPAT